MNKPKKRERTIFKQRNVPRLGGFIDALYGSLPMLSAVNFVSILIVLYTDVQPYLIEYVPWMKLWMFGSILATLVLLLMLVVYKFILPSIWTFRGKQMFSYNSKIMDKLNAIEERLKKIEESKTTKPEGGDK